MKMIGIDRVGNDKQNLDTRIKQSMTNIFFINSDRNRRAVPPLPRPPPLSPPLLPNPNPKAPTSSLPRRNRARPLRRIRHPSRVHTALSPVSIASFRAGPPCLRASPHSHFPLPTSAPPFPASHMALCLSSQTSSSFLCFGIPHSAAQIWKTLTGFRHS
jgi:hypothetical protein